MQGLTRARVITPLTGVKGHETRPMCLARSVWPSDLVDPFMLKDSSRNCRLDLFVLINIFPQNIFLNMLLLKRFHWNCQTFSHSEQ